MCEKKRGRVFCIEHISHVCGPTHAIPTCMNFFYRIADQQSFMIVYRLRAVSLFLVECKTRLRAWLSVTCERQVAMPQGASSCFPMPTLLATCSIVTCMSHSRSRVMIACLLILHSSPRIFKEKRDCSQSRWCDNANRALIYGQISGEPKRLPPLPPPIPHDFFRR